MKKILIAVLMSLMAIAPVWAAGLQNIPGQVTFANVDLSTATVTYQFALENTATAAHTWTIVLSNTTVPPFPGASVPNWLSCSPTSCVQEAATANTNATTNVTFTAYTSNFPSYWPTNQYGTYDATLTDATDGSVYVIKVTIGIRNQYAGTHFLDFGNSRLRSKNGPIGTSGQMIVGQTDSNMLVKTMSGLFTVNASGVTELAAGYSNSVIPNTLTSSNLTALIGINAGTRTNAIALKTNCMVAAASAVATNAFTTLPTAVSGAATNPVWFCISIGATNFVVPAFQIP